MSGPDQYPPPGAPGGQWAPPGSAGLHGMPGGHVPLAPRLPPVVVHRPGAVPLRPLKLGDILDAAVKIVRYNPGATVGASLLVAALSVVVPVVTTFVLWSVTGFTDQLDTAGGSETFQNDAEVFATLTVGASWLVGFAVQYVGIVLVTGMIVQVTAAAVLGRRLSLAAAWAATAGRRWRLVGLILLLGGLVTLAATLYVVVSAVVVVASGSVVVGVIWFVVTLPLLIAGACWFWIKVAFLPAAVLVAEDIGIFASVARGAHLVTGHFWRIFGIVFLINLLTQFAAGIIATPVSILGVLPTVMGSSPELALLFSVGSQVLAIVFATALTTPFLAATTALIHLDLRIRKEAYDVELIQRAGLGQR